jgi:hypothetical protein
VANNKSSLSAVIMGIPMDMKDEDPQGILDNHFNRIFDSTGQTPSRSPGRHSPDRNILSKPLYNSFISQANKSLHHNESLLDNSLGGNSSKLHHRKKDKDSSLYENNVIDDRIFDDSFSHLHNNSKHSLHIHHHHHHHGNVKDIKVHDQSLHSKPSAIQQGYRTTVVYNDRNRAKQPSVGKRPSESTMDTNVNVYDQNSLRVPSVHDASNEK